MFRSLPLRQLEAGMRSGRKAAADSVMPPEPTWAPAAKPEFQGLEERDREYLDSGRFC